MSKSYPLDTLSNIILNWKDFRAINQQYPNRTHLISWILEETANSNSSVPSNVTPFNVLPSCDTSIVIEKYIDRFVKYTQTQIDLLITTIIILDRFLRLNDNICINHYNKHRLFAAAFVCTYKFFDDIYYSNYDLAKIAGISLSELNSLEREFLFNINFALYTSPDIVEKTLRDINMLYIRFLP